MSTVYTGTAASKTGSSPNRGSDPVQLRGERKKERNKIENELRA